MQNQPEFLNSNSQSNPQQLESRIETKQNEWFEKQDEEVLPFEPSASAVKQKQAAEMQLNSPQPFSPAQKTPQKVNGIQNAGQNPITPVAGKSDNDQQRIAEIENTLNGGNCQNQFRSVAQGRKQQPTFIPPSISHHGFGSNNPKNSKIIREKHLQMQKQHNLNQNFGVNTSAYSSSQQSFSGLPSNHRINHSSNTALSPVVGGAMEVQNTDGFGGGPINQAQLMSNFYLGNQNDVNAVSASLDVNNSNFYDSNQSQNRIQNDKEPKVNNFMTEGKENFNTQNSSSRHQRSGQFNRQFLTQPNSELFGSARVDTGTKNSARLTNDPSVNSYTKKQHTLAISHQVEPPRVIAGRSGHQQSFFPEFIKQDLRQKVHGELVSKNSNSLGNLDHFKVMQAASTQSSFVKGGIDFKHQQAIQQIFNQNQQQYTDYAQHQKQSSHSKDNASNIKKIQQLALGDSSEKQKNSQNLKGSADMANESNGKDSSSNTLERDSKVEVVRELEADLNEAAKVQPEGEDTVNELTMHDMTMNQESSHNIFTQEREYDTAELEKAQNQACNGNQESQVGKNGQGLALGGYSQSESNLIMRTSSNNEHTSSSLGKRNYNDFSKKQSSTQDQIPENKSSGKKGRSAIQGYITQGPALQLIDESEPLKQIQGEQEQLTLAQQVSDASNPAIEKRLKKTPARRVKGLRRQNSDIFGKDQVQQSGQKLLGDDSNKNDDSSNNMHLVQMNKLLGGNQIRPMRSDVMMSSQDGDDNTYEALGIQSSNSQILFQKMGMNGQSNKVHGQQVYDYKKFEGQIEFQQHPGDQACSGCAFENGTQKSGSTVEAIQNNQNMNFVQPALQNSSCNHSLSNDIRCKDTPNFLKQKFSQNRVRADIEQAIDSEGANFFKRVIEQEAQNQNVKPFAFHQTVNNNFGNVVVLNEQARESLPLVQTSLRQSICALDMQNTQKKDSILQESDPQSVRRQLFSERTASYSSSIIQTPIQQKRMKLAMDSQHQEGSKRSNKVFEINNQNSSNALYRLERSSLFTAPRVNGEIQQTEVQKQQSFKTTKDGGSPQSWVQRWRCSDPIFENKYSSGATLPLKQRPSNASNYVTEGIRLSNLGRSQSLYFKNPANLTLPKQHVNKFEVEQSQHEMGRTMSPNELKVLSSEQGSNINRKQHDKVRQTLKFEENSDMPEAQEPHTRSNPNPPFFSNAQRISDMEPQQVQKSLFQSMNERRQQMQMFQANQHQQQEVVNTQPRVLNSMIPPNSRESRPLVPQNLQIALIQTENGPSESHGDAQNLFAQGGYQPYILNMQPPGKFNLDRTYSSVSATHSSVHTCVKQISTIRSNGGPKTPVHNNHGFLKRNSQVSVTNTSMNDQSVFSSSMDTEGVGGQFHPKKRRPAQTKVGQFDPIRKLQLNNQPMQTKSFSSSQNLAQNLAAPGRQNTGDISNKSKSQIQCREDGLNATTYSNNQKQPQNSCTPFTNKKVSWLDKEFNRVSKIGRGHFGQVLKCQNKTDNFEYAIKVTNCRIRNPDEQAFYLQEMQTLSALSVEAECPHIVRYFNSWIEDDKIHIVMELCEKSLRQIKLEVKNEQSKDRDQNFIPEQDLMKIIRDVLLGLQELHSKDIVHLDIKPENILMGKTGNFKIADLGMARFLSKITNDVNIPEGDCRYLAKELLSRNELPDLKKADIFSLGITAFELITLGHLEKNGPEWNALRDGSFRYPLKIQNLYSPELLETVRRMLASSANDRPSAQELLEIVFTSQEQRQIRELIYINSQLNEKLYRLSEFLKQNKIDAEQVIQNFDLDGAQNQ